MFMNVYANAKVTSQKSTEACDLNVWAWKSFQLWKAKQRHQASRRLEHRAAGWLPAWRSCQCGTTRFQLKSFSWLFWIFYGFVRLLKKGGILNATFTAKRLLIWSVSYGLLGNRQLWNETSRNKQQAANSPKLSVQNGLYGLNDSADKVLKFSSCCNVDRSIRKTYNSLDSTMSKRFEA